MARFRAYIVEDQYSVLSINETTVSSKLYHKKICLESTIKAKKKHVKHARSN